MKKKGNKKMPSPRHKLIHNTIPTSLFCFKILFVVNASGKEKNLHIELAIHCCLERNKDVGMGL